MAKLSDQQMTRRHREDGESLRSIAKRAGLSHVSVRRRILAHEALLEEEVRRAAERKSEARRVRRSKASRDERARLEGARPELRSEPKTTPPAEPVAPAPARVVSSERYRGGGDWDFSYEDFLDRNDVRAGRKPPPSDKPPRRRRVFAIAW